MKEYESRSVLRRLPVDHIEEIEEESHVGHLAKSLGLWQLTAIGVGGIIGVGIFSLAGLVAHGDADNPGVGPSVLIAFLIAGLASAAAALSYAEFAGMIPRAGSAYTYGYVALGELVGWFIGWDLLLEYIAIVAVVAIGISGYLEAFLQRLRVELPLSDHCERRGRRAVVNIPAVLICLLVDLHSGSRRRRPSVASSSLSSVIKVLLILLHHRVGNLLHQHCQLRPVHAFRLRPGAHRRGDRVLRRLRVRRHEHRRRGGQDGQKHMPKAIILSLIIAMIALCCGNPRPHRYAELHRDRPGEPGSPPPSRSVGLPVAEHHLRLRCCSLHHDRDADLPAGSPASGSR